jgi:hypothetical protein
VIDSVQHLGRIGERGAELLHQGAHHGRDQSGADTVTYDIGDENVKM